MLPCFLCVEDVCLQYLVQIQGLSASRGDISARNNAAVNNECKAL